VSWFACSEDRPPPSRNPRGVSVREITNSRGTCLSSSPSDPPVPANAPGPHVANNRQATPRAPTRRGRSSDAWPMARGERGRWTSARLARRSRSGRGTGWAARDGPWPPWRLAASLEVAGRDSGIRPGPRRTIVRAATREYREAMRTFATKGNLTVWYARVDAERFLDDLAARRPQTDVKGARRLTAKARHKDSERALSKLTERVDGALRFRDEPPLIARAASLANVDEDQVLAELQELLARYRSSLPDHTATLR